MTKIRHNRKKKWLIFYQNLGLTNKWPFRLTKIRPIYIPLNPGKQSHMYPLTSSTQVALFWHGFDMHSLTSISQVFPKERQSHQSCFGLHSVWCAMIRSFVHWSFCYSSGAAQRHAKCAQDGYLPWNSMAIEWQHCLTSKGHNFWKTASLSSFVCGLS